MKTKSPSKQRKRNYIAPLHKRQKMVGSHLSKDLKKQLNKRTIAVRKGDEVKVMRGKFRGTTGKVSKVDLKKIKIYIDGIKRSKSTGEDVQLPIHPSNLLITNPIMDDPRRKKSINRGSKNEKT